MNRRRGFSLIEVLTALTVWSTILGLCVGMLATLFRAQGAVRDRLHHQATLTRLEEQFRADAYAAQSVTLDPTASGWMVHSTLQRPVTYHAEPGGLVREEQVGEGPPRQERFVLPPGMVASIHVDSENSPAIVSLRISPLDRSSSSMPGRTVRIDAALAADHRFAALEVVRDEVAVSPQEDSDD